MIYREHDTHKDSMAKVVNALVVISATGMLPELAKHVVLIDSQYSISHFCSSLPERIWPVVMLSELAGSEAFHSQPDPHMSARLVF